MRVYRSSFEKCQLFSRRLSHFLSALTVWLCLSVPDFSRLSVIGCPAGRRQYASQSLSALITAVTLLGRSLSGSNKW